MYNNKIYNILNRVRMDEKNLRETSCKSSSLQSEKENHAIETDVWELKTRTTLTNIEKGLFTPSTLFQ